MSEVSKFLSDFIKKSGYRNTIFDIVACVEPSVLRQLSSEAKEKVKRMAGGMTLSPTQAFKEAWDAVNSKNAESKDSVKKPCREDLEYPDFPVVEIDVSSSDHHYALPAGRYFLYYPPQDEGKVKEIDRIHAWSDGQKVVMKSGERFPIREFFAEGEFELIEAEDLPPNP